MMCWDIKVILNTISCFCSLSNPIPKKYKTFNIREFTHASKDPGFPSRCLHGGLRHTCTLATNKRHVLWFLFILEWAVCRLLAVACSYVTCSSRSQLGNGNLIQVPSLPTRVWVSFGCSAFSPGSVVCYCNLVHSAG